VKLHSKRVEKIQIKPLLFVHPFAQKFKLCNLSQEQRPSPRSENYTRLECSLHLLHSFGVYFHTNSPGVAITWFEKFGEITKTNVRQGNQYFTAT
jgi:hypothetical protein